MDATTAHASSGAAGPDRSPTTPPVIAVLGLGEAGSLIARDLLAAGAVVRAYDPVVSPAAGLVACAGDAEATAGADLVLSVNSAHDALDALLAGLPSLAPDAIWADLNTGSPRLKQQLSDAAAERDRAFVDIALMAPVPGRGLRTPMLASGPGASGYAEVMGPLGAHVDVLGDAPGLAATRKLLRSVFYKGMAAAVVEALTAAERAGQDGWLRAHLAEELSAETVDRLERGTYRHARRRRDEMRAASELLEDLGVAPHISSASGALLADLTDSGKSRRP